MTNYYTIHIQDLPSGTEHYSITSIYESYDDACDALEKEIVKFDPTFVPPSNRKKLHEESDGSPVYHTTKFKIFGIMQRKFVPTSKTA